MYLYLFEGVSDLTDSYHSGGSVMYLVNDEKDVETLKSKDTVLTKWDWDNVKIFPLAPDYETDIEVFTFEDSGCC